MCIVEIQGRPTTPTACTTPVEEGMIIQTASAKVQALRRELLQMLLAEHPCACLVCPEKDHCEECMVTLRKAGVTTGCRSCAKDGQCELQELAANIGITGVDYPIRYRALPVEKYDPFFDRDYNLCVLCARCIRVCEDLHFANALAYTSRGTHTLVGTAFHRTHFNATCSFCGACVEVCPTGALSEKTRKWDGKPEREVTTTCPLCSIGCPMKLVIKNGRVIGSLPDGKTGALCVKGRFGITELVNHPTRLRQPHKRVGAESLGISWDEAARNAAETLAACSPGRFGLLISAGSTNEDLYVAQKFAREVMRSENIYTTAQARYGDGLGALSRLLQKSQPLDILADAPSRNTPILCLGLDGRYAQSVVEVQLHRVKTRGDGAAGSTGAKLLTINAQPHALSDYADEWLQPEPGNETTRIQQLAEWISSTPRPEGQGRQAAGAQLERVARLLREASHAQHAPGTVSSRPVIILGPDFLSHPDNARLLAAVEMLAENCGARVIVLAEQGNLAGSLYLVRQAAAQADARADAQDLDVLYLLGASVPAGVPEHTRILYQNIYPPAGERPADLLLPAAAFSEVDGTLVDYAGRVRSLHPAVPAPGEALPAWEILCRIARQMGAPGFDYTSAAEIQAEMAGLLPDGRVDWEQALYPAFQPLPLALQVSEHDYMGFPLSHWVEGLRMIYPEE